MREKIDQFNRPNILLKIALEKYVVKGGNNIREFPQCQGGSGPLRPPVAGSVNESAETQSHVHQVAEHQEVQQGKEQRQLWRPGDQGCATWLPDHCGLSVARRVYYTPQLLEKLA